LNEIRLTVYLTAVQYMFDQ